MRVHWTARRSNQSILKEINSEYSLECLILKLQYFGHLMRRANSLEKMPMVKNLPANAGDIRVTSLIPESGRSPEKGHGNPLQYSCLENSMDRGAWQAIVHRVAQSWTLLERLHTHTLMLEKSKGRRKE